MGMGGLCNIVRAAVPAVPRDVMARWFMRQLLLACVSTLFELHQNLSSRLRALCMYFAWP